MALRKHFKIVGIILIFIFLVMLFFLGYRLRYDKNIEKINSNLLN